MSDDLEALRKAVEAFGRRKNELSPEGKQALNCVTTNLKTYAKAMEGYQETRDERVMKLVRSLILDDIATIERDLTTTRKEEGAE
jgi:hypothetical protein